MNAPIAELQQLIENSQLSEAEQKARLWVQENPEEIEARITLGRILGMRGKNTEAATQFEEALQIDDKHFEATFYLAIANETQKKYEEAIEIYKKALNLNQNTARIHYRLGRIYNNYEFSGKSEFLALFHLRQATTSENPPEGAFLELATIGPLSRSVYVLQNGLNRHPQSLQLHERLSWYLYRLEKYADCVAAIESAYKQGLD